MNDTRINDTRMKDTRPRVISSPVVEVKRLSKTYHTPGGEIQVLKSVNLFLLQGEMVAIMGPSGSGKSSLMFILGLFQPPSSGEYLVTGQDVLSLDANAQADFRSTKMGFVFQSCDLLENSTVYENLEFPLMYRGLERKDRGPLIREALKRVGLAHRIKHPANYLSGGERQRVAVARSLVNDPPFILADEPTGQLDAKNSQMVMGHFQHLVENDRKAVLIVTHDPAVAKCCHRICVLREGMLHEA
jgi:putative ABC transport system ATP-binding protein